MKKLRQNRGQTLIEIAIGMTILSVVLLTATSTAVSSSQQGTNSYIDLLGSEFAQEGIEQMTLYRNYCASQTPAYNGCVAIENWAPAQGTTYRVLNASGWGEGNWSLGAGTSTPPTAANLPAGEDPFTPARFTRYIQITDVTNTTIESAGIVEMEVKVVVTWKDADGNTQSENGTTILSNWNGG